MLKVVYNRSDVGITILSITAARNEVVDYTVPILPDEMRWMSKAPDKIPPFMNLLNAFDSGSWISTFLTYIVISFILYITVRVGQFYGIRQPDTANILLTPLAMLNAEGMPAWFNTRRYARGVAIPVQIAILPFKSNQIYLR